MAGRAVIEVARELAVAEILSVCCEATEYGFAPTLERKARARAEWEAVAGSVSDVAELAAEVDADLAGQLACHQARRAWIVLHAQDPAQAVAERPEADPPGDGELEWLDALVAAYEGRESTVAVLAV